MKVAILAGGLGSRLSEETVRIPKPLVEVGDLPVIRHVMGIYAHHGLTDFVIATGYKKEMLDAYFEQSFAAARTAGTRSELADWSVRLVDTGQDTMTGGRIKRLRPFLGDGTFMLTWCDGLADIDVSALLAFHQSHGRLATVTAVRPPARFGRLSLDGARVTDFSEKPADGEGWINGAFFVLEPQVLDYIDGDETMWEHAPMQRLAAEGQLMAYFHNGFWQCMDTLREKETLTRLCERNEAPWRFGQ